MNYFIFTVVLLAVSINKLNAYEAKCTSNDTGRFILETNNGKIKGNCQHVTLQTDKHTIGENVYSWLSIPFAEPPTGANRFEAPKPVKPWSGILDGTKWPNTCVKHVDESSNKPEEQFNGYKMWTPSPKYTNYSEDCLYLNLFLPIHAYKKSAINAAPPKVPIVIFLHGSSGTTALDIFDPTNLVATTGVIAVTITHRSEVFGGLFLEGEVQGNQGFLDQHLAIKWVYTNAERFGGDPSKITLYGSSMGAMAIGLHLMYRPSWPLFRNVILQSGSPFVNAMKPISGIEATYRARNFLIALNCGNTSSTNAELLSCARKHDPFVLAKRANEFFKNHKLEGNAYAELYSMTYFPPVIDGAVLTETPDEAFKSNNFKSCSILSGFTTNEGSMYLAYAGLMGSKNSELKKQVSIHYNKVVEFVTNYFKYYPNFPHKSTKLIVDLILFHYTKLTSDYPSDSALGKLNYFNVLSRIIGDQLFVCPILKLNEIYARRNHSVYSYVYSHRISTSPWPTWYGPVHADELAMVFGQPVGFKSQNSAISTNPWLTPKNGYPKAEKILSYEMMKYWSSFIKYDNPNIPDTDLDDETLKEWPLYNVSSSNINENTQYMMLKTNGSKPARSYSFEDCQFWNHLLPLILSNEAKMAENYIKVPPVTCPPPPTTTPISSTTSQPKNEVKAEQVKPSSSASIKTLNQIILILFNTVSLLFIFSFKLVF